MNPLSLQRVWADADKKFLKDEMCRQHWFFFSFIWICHEFSSLIIVFLNHWNENRIINGFFSQSSISVVHSSLGYRKNVWLKHMYPGPHAQGQSSFWKMKFEQKEHFMRSNSTATPCMELSLKSHTFLWDSLPYFCRLQRPREVSKLACVCRN